MKISLDNLNDRQQSIVKHIVRLLISANEFKQYDKTYVQCAFAEIDDTTATFVQLMQHMFDDCIEELNSRPDGPNLNINEDYMKGLRREIAGL